MNSTKFKVEDIIGDVISKNSISQEQILKLNIFFSQGIVNKNIKINPNFFKPRRKTIIGIEPSAPPFFKTIFVFRNGFVSKNLFLRRSSSKPSSC